LELTDVAILALRVAGSRIVLSFVAVGVRDGARRRKRERTDELLFQMNQKKKKEKNKRTKLGIRSLLSNLNIQLSTPNMY
jgi:hypothetical protein